MRKKSLTALKDKIRRQTKRTRGHSLERIIQDLNPTLRGWFGYFKHARYSTFRGIANPVAIGLSGVRRSRAVIEVFAPKIAVCVGARHQAGIETTRVDTRSRVVGNL